MGNDADGYSVPVRRTASLPTLAMASTASPAVGASSYGACRSSVSGTAVQASYRECSTAAMPSLSNMICPAQLHIEHKCVRSSAVDEEMHLMKRTEHFAGGSR